MTIWPKGVMLCPHNTFSKITYTFLNYMATLDKTSQSLQWLIDMLYPVLEGTRNRRKFIENEWLMNYRAWQGWPSQNYQIPLGDGGIHYFIPHARRAIERNVKRATKLLMPNMDWHETLPSSSSIPHDVAESVHNVMNYIYRKRLPTKRNISSGLRCLQMYDFTVLSASAIIDNNEVWPWQETIDPFNFYVFPDTAINIEKALVIFEDCIIPYQVYMSYVDRDNPKKSLYEYIDAEQLHKPEWPYHLVERLSYRGLTNPDEFVDGIGPTNKMTEKDFDDLKKKTNDNLNKQSKAFVALSKIYFRMASEWYYCVLCTNIRGGGDNKYNCKVVRLDETENRPLYRWTNTRPLPGELYTNSAMDDIRVLQNLTNNALSQVEANRARFAEPPICFDSNMFGRVENKVFGNRQAWLIDGNPSDAIKSLDVEDTSTNGIRAVQIYKGMLDQNSGGGLPEGQPGRNMPRAGFAANTLLNMSLTDIEDDADTFEQEILTPGLADIYHIVLEYVPMNQIIKIPNRNPQLVKQYKRKDLYGDYSFTWLGSLGFQDAQVRADKFVQFFNVLMNPQVMQIIMQQLQGNGETLDIASMLRTIYSYGLGEKGLGDIIRKLTPQELQKLNQPDPQLQLEQQKTQQELQVKQADAQIKQQQGQQDLAIKQADARMKQQATAAKTQSDIQKAQIDTQGKVLDFELKRRQAEQQIQNMTIQSMLGGTQNNRNR